MRTPQIETSRKTIPVDTLDSGLQNCGEIYFCHLSPSLWYFVMAALANEYTQLVGMELKPRSLNQSLGAFLCSTYNDP